jgi:tagatose-1,6-bisphosphate aldolase
MIKEVKGKLAEELYALRASSITTDPIFGIRQLIEKNRNMEKSF